MAPSGSAARSGSAAFAPPGCAGGCAVAPPTAAPSAAVANSFRHVRIRPPAVRLRVKMGRLIPTRRRREKRSFELGSFEFRVQSPARNSKLETPQLETPPDRYQPVTPFPLD